MRKQKFKIIMKLFAFILFLSTAHCYANYDKANDGNPVIIIREGIHHGDPKSSSIQATIDGHTLTVVFTENLGQVNIEVSAVSGVETQVESTPTPNGVLFYIYATGSYIVTFSLPNGDEYYGEFEVTD